MTVHDHQAEPDLPVTRLPETFDIFRYDGQRFHQESPGNISRRYSLRPLPLEPVDPTTTTTKWYFCLVDETGLRGPIGFCTTGCPGHETPAEACAHYGQYLFEMMTLGLYLPVLGKAGPCVVCRKQTRGYAEIVSPYYTQSWFLCGSHRSATVLEKRFRYTISPDSITLLIEPYTRYRSSYQNQKRRIHRKTGKDAHGYA